MKNDASSSQYSSQIGPWCVMGAFRGLKVTQKLPKAPQKGPQDGPRATLGSPRGTPRAAKGPQRAPRGSPKATLRGVWGGKIEQKLVTEAKKVDFGKSAPRLGPADARSTSDPLNSPPNRPRMIQSRFLEHLERSFGRLWSRESASGALGDRLGLTPTP